MAADELAYKPGSVRGPRSEPTAIYLRWTLPTPLAVYPETGRAALNASCLTLLRARFAKPPDHLGLLVVSYTTVSPLPPPEDARAVCFLLHFPAGCPGWVLPTALLCGARTFLGGASEETQRDRPANSSAAIRVRRRTLANKG